MVENFQLVAFAEVPGRAFTDMHVCRIAIPGVCPFVNTRVCPFAKAQTHTHSKPDCTLVLGLVVGTRLSTDVQSDCEHPTAHRCSIGWLAPG